MLDIKYKNKEICIEWQYSIKNNIAKKKNKAGDKVEYIFHTTILPGEVVRYFNHPRHVYLYTWNGEHILTAEEPVHTDAVKVVLMDKGQQESRNITLSKRVFDIQGYTDKKVRYVFHTMRESFDGTRGVITVEIV